jgi:hypothetical protein
MALTKITSSVVAVNSLTVANIADNAVDATKIASNSILTRHIDDNQIGIDQLNVSDGSSGQALTTNGSGTLSFATVGVSGIASSADATAITIDSSENVGIGTGSPTQTLDVRGGSGAGDHTHAIFTGTAGRGLALKSGQTGGQHNGKAIIDAQDTESGGASMDFQIGGNTKLAIDNSGRLMIGTTTEGRAGEGADMFTIGDDGSNNSGLTMRSGTSGYGSIYFSDATTGTGEYAGYLQYSHANERLHIATGSSIMLNVDSDGLKFNNDTAAANALDDYEEGTWTPTFGGASGTYVGKYTKIGDTVHLFYHFLMSGGMPTSSSQVQIGGLPFTSSSSYLSSGSIYARYYTPNDSTLTTIIMDGESVIRLVNINETSFDYTLYGELEASHNNAVYIIGQITYTV